MLTFPDFGIAKLLPSKAFSRTSKIRRNFLLAWKYHFRHCNSGYHGRLFNKQTFRFLLVSNKKMKTFQFLCPQFLAPFPKELEKDILTWLINADEIAVPKNIAHLVAKHFPHFYPKNKDDICVILFSLCSRASTQNVLNSAAKIT